MERRTLESNRFLRASWPRSVGSSSLRIYPNLTSGSFRTIQKRRYPLLDPVRSGTVLLYASPEQALVEFVREAVSMPLYGGN